MHVRGTSEPFVREVLGKCTFRGAPVGVIFVEPVLRSSAPAPTTSTASAPTADRTVRMTLPTLAPRRGRGGASSTIASSSGAGAAGVPYRPTRGAARGRGGPGGARGARPLPQPPAAHRVNPYNALFRLLVRERFRGGVLDLSATAGAAPYALVDYASPLQVSSLVYCIKRECAGCTTLCLDGNGLTSVAGLAHLGLHCPTVRHVSLRNNRLASPFALDPLADLRLLELNVAGNPFCAQQPPARTAEQLSAKHVYLQVLDGARVPGAKPVAPGSEPQLAPPFHESLGGSGSGTSDSDSSDSIAAQVVEAATQLLEQEHKDAAVVQRMYAADAHFSLAASVLGNTVYPDAVFRLARANPSPRAAAAAAARNLFTGPERICATLNRLPPMAFERDKTYHESLANPAVPGLAGIYVSGTVNFRSTHLFSYTRTLHIFAAPTGVAIVSDHITLMPYHGGPVPATLFAPPFTPGPDAVAEAVAAVRRELSSQTQSQQQQPQQQRVPTPAVAATVPAPAPAPVPATAAVPAPAAPVQTPEQRREELVKQLMAETKLNRAAAESCLSCSDWDHDRALATFRDLHAKHQIPLNNFVVQCSDDDVCAQLSSSLPIALPVCARAHLVR